MTRMITMEASQIKQAILNSMYTIMLIDIGEGAIVRYREETGLTLIGIKERLLESLKTNGLFKNNMFTILYK